MLYVVCLIMHRVAFMSAPMSVCISVVEIHTPEASTIDTAQFRILTIKLIKSNLFVFTPTQFV